MADRPQQGKSGGSEDGTWTSRNILRLDAEIAAATTIGQRQLLLAKKAGALARLAMLHEADRIVQELRIDNPDYEPQLSAWIMFAEGLIEHFSSLGDQAFDRFRRAYAIGLAIGDEELAATSSAWIANAALMNGNVRAIAEPLTQTFRLAGRENNEALGRACLVIADALSWAGESARAKHWYLKSRGFAVDEGDIAMQSVVLFNAAAFRVANVVSLDCERGADKDAVSLAAMSVESVASLDYGLGIDALSTMVPLLRAEVRSVERRWLEAISLFEANIGTAQAQGQARLVPKHQAELAYCLAKVGRLDQAFAELASALGDKSRCTDPDDLYVLHSRAAAVLDELGRPTDAEDHRNRAADRLAEFRDFQCELRSAIHPLIEQVALARA
ncbi:MAG: hypothetical protein HY855_24370 [Burkholderiales bacterium]|nr:hypothetical protein [Burkholderiales bacterium]